MIRKVVLVCSLGCAATSWSADCLVGANLGAAWFTAPSTDAKADGLRTGILFLGDGWVDRNDWGVGLDVSSVVANHEGTNRMGASDHELVALTSGVLMTGTTIKIQEFPARVRVAVGAGAVHSWDDLTRDGQSYQQEAWGVEYHLAGIWERELGRHGLVRIRLAAVKSSTFEAPITGTNLRTASDWSRLEFTMGWAWRT
jgi:hypothetical protein